MSDFKYLKIKSYLLKKNLSINAKQCFLNMLHKLLTCTLFIVKFKISYNTINIQANITKSILAITYTLFENEKTSTN